MKSTFLKFTLRAIKIKYSFILISFAILISACSITQSPTQSAYDGLPIGTISSRLEIEQPQAIYNMPYQSKPNLIQAPYGLGNSYFVQPQSNYLNNNQTVEQHSYNPYSSSDRFNELDRQILQEQEKMLRLEKNAEITTKNQKDTQPTYNFIWPSCGYFSSCYRPHWRWGW